MPTKSECIRKAEQMQVFFEEIAQEVAYETGFVQRTSKLDGTSFSQTLVLGYLDNAQASLNDLAQVSADLGISISSVGLHSRINEKSVVFMKRLSERALSCLQDGENLPLEVLKAFTQVNIVDSTIIKLPPCLAQHFPGVRTNGSEAALKVQLSYEYLSGRMNAIRLEAGRSPDQKSDLPLQFAQVGSLTLMDLGYFDQKTFAHIAESGGYFISRLQSQVGLYEIGAEQSNFDILAYLNQVGMSSGDTTVLMGSKQRLAVRLISIPLPADVVAERRRKAQAKARKHGHTCSQRTLDLLAWALFVTNVPCAWLSAESIALIYRVRWQVELIFKLWKSQAKINRIAAWRIERVLCQFYARFLGVILLHWLSAKQRVSQWGELSLPKAYAVLRRQTTRLLDAIADTWFTVASVLDKIIKDFRRFALKNKRQKSLSTYQLLVLADA